jgi:SAM-dependent methyltransferase
MPPEKRSQQLAYSEQQVLMLDEQSRRPKARKMLSVLQHFLGRASLEGLTILDVGCSSGIVDDELRRSGARVLGIDIDVPGLAKAGERFGDVVSFLCADSERMPLADDSVDVVICNHVYEHVLDPVALFAELRRVLRPDGVAYLGLGNRLGIVEPHYKLPFLSWLPRPLAHRYVRAFGRAEHYHESFSTLSGLRRLTEGFSAWDYTYAVLADPVTFSAGDVVPTWTARIPQAALRAARPLVPTYIWVATLTPTHPRGPRLPVPPTRVS